MKRLEKLLIRLARVTFAAGMTYLAIWPLANAVKYHESWIFQYPGLFPLMLISGLLLAFIVSVAIHEVGHVVAGKRAGFRFAFLLAWPIQVRHRGDGGFAVRPMFKSGLGLGGMAGMAPVKCDNLRQGYLELLRGGPIASLGLGLSSIVIALVSGVGSSVTGGVFWMMGVISLLLFIICIIPRVSAGYLTDGAAIRLLSRGDVEKVDVYVAALEISTEIMAGTRPKDLMPEQLERLLKAGEDDPMWHRGLYFNFLSAADRGDLKSAREQMDRILADPAKIPLLVRTNYLVYHAWLLASEGKPGEARAQLQLARGGVVEPCCRVMVEATILAAEGKTAEAVAMANRVPGLIKKSMLPEAQAFTRIQAAMLQSVLEHHN